MPLNLSDEAVRRILAFRDDRHWSRFHNPKDLALALTVEAAELLDVFKWSAADLECSEKTPHLAEELADVLIYAVMLADRAGIDLDAAVEAKLRKNAERYPAELCRADNKDEARRTCEALQQEGRAREAAKRRT